MRLAQAQYAIQSAKNQMAQVYKQLETLLSRLIETNSSAVNRGVRLGRPKRLTPKQVAQARKMLTQGLHKDIIAKKFGVSVRTIYRIS